MSALESIQSNEGMSEISSEAGAAQSGALRVMQQGALVGTSLLSGGEGVVTVEPIMNAGAPSALQRIWM